MEIIERAGMLDFKPCTTPVDTSSKISGDTGDPVSSPTHYRSLPDALQYLTFTCLDILYAVQQVCLHVHDPRESHMTVLKSTLDYLQGNLDFGLLLHRSSTSELVVYSDADWARCPDTHQSTSGYAVLVTISSPSPPNARTQSLTPV
jgi:hypothetical protein